jgi:hypothetical protein
LWVEHAREQVKADIEFAAAPSIGTPVYTPLDATAARSRLWSSASSKGRDFGPALKRVIEGVNAATSGSFAGAKCRGL